jgi:hypothetical protein
MRFSPHPAKAIEAGVLVAAVGEDVGFVGLLEVQRLTFGSGWSHSTIVSRPSYR